MKKRTQQATDCPYCEGEGVVEDAYSFLNKVCTRCDGEGIIWFDGEEDNGYDGDEPPEEGYEPW